MEEILIHAIYQINAQLHDRIAKDDIKLKNIKRIVKQTIKYYEDYYESLNKPITKKIGE